MGETTLILVRHGETEWNRQRRIQGQQDSALTAEGRYQAARVSEAIAHEKIRAAHASDLGRAIDTAKIICGPKDLAFKPDHRLRERGFGQAEGETWDNSLKRHGEKFQRSYSGIDYAELGIEPLGAVRDRAFASLQEIAQANPSQTSLVITHGGILAVILKEILGLPLNGPRNFDLRNCAINRIINESGAWKLASWGETRHLENQSLDEL
ncbi:MAG: histidine phosphatase family protein [Verrucomicrobiota bacterium]